MKDFGTATTIQQLRDKLTEIIEQYGPDVTWHGWDDGSIILSKGQQEFGFINAWPWTS